MIPHRLSFLSLLFIVILSTESDGAVKVENATKFALTIWVKGPHDKVYRGPYRIRRGRQKNLPLEKGRYYVVASVRNGSFVYLGWQDYSNHKIVYSLDVSICCGAGDEIEAIHGRSENYPLQAEVFHRTGAYRCRHGRMHTRWKSSEIRAESSWSIDR